jgi:hypothetical protein
MAFYSLGALIVSFLKHKRLIYYQRDSAKAEPSQDPFLPVEIRSSQPKNQANQGACRERKAEDTTEPFLSRAAPTWHCIAKALKNSKRTTLLRKQVAQSEGC